MSSAATKLSNAVAEAAKADRRVIASLAGMAEPGLEVVPAWLARLRLRCLELAGKTPIPTTHDEDWRFTNLAPLLSRTFRAAPADIAVPEDGLDGVFLRDCPHIRLVFVNGVFCPPLSTLPVDGGVRVGALSARDVVLPEWVESNCRDVYEGPINGFVVLNSACFRDAAWIEVRPDSEVSTLIHLVFVTTAGGQPVVVHPRAIVRVGALSRVVLIETHLGIGTGEYFSNPLTSVYAEQSSQLDYYRMQYEHKSAFHIGICRVRQKRDSCVSAHVFSFGGGLARQELEVSLDEPGSVCTASGLSMAMERQHTDTHLRIVHGATHTASREVFRTILADQARGVFSGRIVVAPGAQGTDAKQSNMNLLLSDDARAYSRPQLEIFADDVKCTHGATAGRLSEEALFYLRSRGLPAATARSLLVHAFAAEMLEAVRVEALRKQVYAALRSRLAECAGAGEVP